MIINKKQLLGFVLFSLAITAVIAAVFFCLYLHAKNSMESLDSELCMTANLAQQIIQMFPHQGVLYTYYNRALIEILANIPFIAVFGFSCVTSIMTQAIPVALSIFVMGLSVWMSREKSEWQIELLPMCVFSCLATAFMVCNSGHVLSYFIGSCYFYAISHKGKMPVVNYVLIATICIFGYMNDDFLLLMTIVPFCACQILNLFAGKLFRWRELLASFFGVMLGAVVIRLLQHFMVFQFMKVPLCLIRTNDVFDSLCNVVKTYGYILNVCQYMGRPLETIDLISLLLGLVVCGAIIVVVSNMIRRWRECDDLRLTLLLSAVTITLAYWLVDTPTRSIVSQVQTRYLYFALCCLLCLMTDYVHKNWGCPFQIAVFGSAAMIFCLFVNKNIIKRADNINSRDELRGVVEFLKSRNVRGCLADYWLYNTLGAVAGGEVNCFNIWTGKTFYLSGAYGCECNAIVLPAVQRMRDKKTPEEQIKAYGKIFGEPASITKVGEYYALLYDENIAYRKDPVAWNKEYPISATCAIDVGMQGFFNSDSGGTWTMARKCVLRLPVPRSPVRHAKIEFKVSGYHRSRFAVIYVNGHRATTWSYADGKSKLCGVDVELDEGATYVDIGIEQNSVSRPCDVQNMSGSIAHADKVTRGLRIHSVKFIPGL